MPPKVCVRRDLGSCAGLQYKVQYEFQCEHPGHVVSIGQIKLKIESRSAGSSHLPVCRTYVYAALLMSMAELYNDAWLLMCHSAHALLLNSCLIHLVLS